MTSECLRSVLKKEDEFELSRRTHGLSLGPEIAIVTLGTDGNVSLSGQQNKARPSPSIQPPPTKKPKNIPIVSLEVGFQGEGEPSNDVSWRNHLKSQKRSDGKVETPIQTAWDSRYPVNRVLGLAIGSTDPEKVAAMAWAKLWLLLRPIVYWLPCLVIWPRVHSPRRKGEHNQLENHFKELEESLKTC